jgi:hypothetical protein
MIEDPKKKLARDIALFRHSVLGELIHFPLGRRGLYELLHAKSQVEYEMGAAPLRRTSIDEFELRG